MSSINEALRRSKRSSDMMPGGVPFRLDSSQSGKKSGVGWWVLLLIVIAGGAGYYWYQNSLNRNTVPSLAINSAASDRTRIEFSTGPAKTSEVSKPPVSMTTSPNEKTSSSPKTENTPAKSSTLTRRVEFPAKEAAEKTDSGQQPTAVTVEPTTPAPPKKIESSAETLQTGKAASADAKKDFAEKNKTVAVKSTGQTKPSTTSGAETDSAAETKATAEPETAIEHFQLARTAQDEGRDSQAIYHYRQAILLDPRLAQAYLNLGNLFYFRQRTPEKAMEMYKRVLTLDPTNDLAHNNLGVLFLKRDMLGQAETAFKAALDKNPDYVDALYNMACLSARRGKGDQAMTYLTRAAKLKPEVAVWAAEDNDLKNLRRRKDFNKFLRQDAP